MWKRQKRVLLLTQIKPFTYVPVPLSIVLYWTVIKTAEKETKKELKRYFDGFISAFYIFAKGKGSSCLFFDSVLDRPCLPVVWISLGVRMFKLHEAHFRIARLNFY